MLRILMNFRQGIASHRGKEMVQVSPTATIGANDALKTDNVILKNYLREAKAQIITLEKRLDQFAHHSELDETDILILKEIALTSEPAAAYVAAKLSLDLSIVEFRLERLREIDYLTTWSIGSVERYSIEPKSREYLIKKNLIG